MDDFVIFYETDVKTGEVKEIKHYLTQQEKDIYAQQAFEKSIKDFTDAVQEHLDKAAQNKGYDNIVSACSYGAVQNPFQKESILFIAWRGEVWSYCYQELDKVKTGTRPIPDLQDFINELPTISFE